MKPVISELVQRYESGGLSRRELIQGLSLLFAAAAHAPGTAAAQTPAAAVAQDPAPLVPTGVDHVSVRVKDLQRSAQFYQSLFGLRPLSQDEPHRILRLGADRVIVSLRQDPPHGTIDHFGLAIRQFDREATVRTLQQRGLTPQEDWEYGFYVRDPDGVPVQMVKAP